MVNRTRLCHGSYLKYYIMQIEINIFFVTEKVEVLEAHILDDKVTLNDLACYQNYSIRVAASTKAGDGLKSRSIYCRTKEDCE